MTTEFDLSCATCGSPLSKRTVSLDHLNTRDVEAAVCGNCGDRYFPESTLERLD
jgi:transcription elongation factor Elf1